jgi:hypothetical protein
MSDPRLGMTLSMTNQREKKIADARPPPNIIKKRLD